MAFQCRNCGATEPAGAAGDNAVPGACHVCRAGVEYVIHPGGTGFDRVFHPENWIVLADLSDKELAKDFPRHGLKPDDVVAHKAKHAGPPPGGLTFVTTAEEAPGAKDRAAQH